MLKFKNIAKKIYHVTTCQPRYNIDNILVYYNYLLIKGWSFNEYNPLIKLTLYYHHVEMATGEIGLPSQDLQLNGSNLRFQIDAKVPKGFNIKAISLKFVFKNKKTFTLDCQGIVECVANNRLNNHYSLDNFIELLKENNCNSILEIGSRARSNVVRKELFGELEYTGLDIHAGENVDVVGDAHNLSSIFQGKKFDAVVSLSTFEHLLMPWKVALEINNVLKIGGIGFITTHQSCGLHDLPWDYWRFSDLSWHALFNKYTGFEVINTFMADPMYLIPFVAISSAGIVWEGYENAAGFYTSMVVFRKISETHLSWDVSSKEISIGSYPV